jgi:hypothetical protein
MIMNRHIKLIMKYADIIYESAHTWHSLSDHSQLHKNIKKEQN